MPCMPTAPCGLPLKYDLYLHGKSLLQMNDRGDKIRFLIFFNVLPTSRSFQRAI